MDRTDNSIQIKEPCHENWNKMTQSEKGRFCQSCQKEVVDFTNSSRDDILTHLSTASDSTCGRVYAHQLDEQPVDCNSTSPNNNKFIYKLKSVGLSLMAFLGFSLVTDDAKAQVVGEIPWNGGLTHDVNQNNVVAEKTVISGSVRESHSKSVIAGANITIESGGKMIADGFTDEHGKYSITIPSEKIVNKKFTITAYADEFEPIVMREMPVDKEHITCNLSMEWGVMIMGDMELPPEEPTEFEELFQEEEPKEEAQLEDLEEYSMMQGQMVAYTPQEEIRPSNKELDAEAIEQPISRPIISGMISVLPHVPVEETDGETNPPVAVQVNETELLNSENEERENEDPIEPDGENAGEPTSTESATENAAITATVYPNPTTDECNIELAKAGTYNVEVFDNAGRHVASRRFNGSKLNLDVSAFERGVYHIRIMSEEVDYAQTLELVVQ